MSKKTRLKPLTLTEKKMSDIIFIIKIGKGKDLRKPKL